MSPVLVVLKSITLSLKVLGLAAITVLFVGALPDGSDAADADTARARQARQVSPPAPRAAPRVAVSVSPEAPAVVTSMITFDLTSIPAAAFGDRDEPRP